MDDAVLGMAAERLGRDVPRWLVVRNASDPQINGAWPTEPDVQVTCAVFSNENYGYDQCEQFHRDLGRRRG